jgi:hypothetical protein
LTFKLVMVPEYIPYTASSCETDYVIFYGATSGHPPFILEYHQNLLDRGYTDKGFYGDYDSLDPEAVYAHVFQRPDSVTE